MKASGRIKRGQHSQSIEPSRPTKPTYNRLTCSAANAQNGVVGSRTNLRAKEGIELTSAGWQSQDVNKRLK
jgi:hypothetical protein